MPGPREEAPELARLERALEPIRAALTHHAIYDRVADMESLRVFMANHVFAVWDFMTLLKLLQRRLTCIEVPWLPPRDTTAARLINEIVLNEESDEIAPGHYVGHFHLYLAAMQEVDADSRPIRDFIAILRQGAAPEAALDAVPILPATREFVRGTLGFLERPVHEVAAAFLLGREELVPLMFTRILHYLEARGARCASFRCYLERHIALDTAEHGPLARRMLAGLCGADPRKWREATEAARSALQARLSLWEGIADILEPISSLSRAKGNLVAR